MTYKHKVNGRSSVFVTVSHGEDGQVQEMFLDYGKAGSMMRDLMSAFGIAVSLGLQHGLPASALAEGMSGFEAGSLPDALVKCLEPLAEDQEHARAAMEAGR